MKKSTEDWIVFAKSDLKAAELLIQDDTLTNIIAYHSQQVIEKSFKAILEEFESTSLKTHNLLLLFNKIRNFINFEVDLNALEKINEVYLDSRYPSEIGLLPYGQPSTKDTIEFVNFAKEILSNTIILLK